MSKSTPILVAIFALLATVSLPSGARAQTDQAPATSSPTAPGGEAAAEKPKPKPKPTITVLVTNNRATGLAELDASPAGEGQSKKILTKLAPGKKATVHLPKGKSCLYDLHGSYDDGTSTDFSGIDLCKDGKINLVE